MLKRTFIIALVSGGAVAQPAFAQSEAGAEDGSGGDIVVTAQRRESRLQDVPQAVTAFGTETLERLAIRDTERLSLNTPGLTFTPVAPSEPNLGLRGLSTDFGLAPAVSVFTNDTPFAFRTHAFRRPPRERKKVV